MKTIAIQEEMIRSLTEEINELRDLGRDHDS
jgi:hypothetical protein